MTPPSSDPRVVHLDLDGATWRWVREFLDSRRHSALAALKSPETPSDQVDFHRGALAVCEDLVSMVEAHDERRQYNETHR